jgi:mannosyltransferase
MMPALGLRRATQLAAKRGRWPGERFAERRLPPLSAALAPARMSGVPRVRDLWLLAPVGAVAVAIVVRFVDLGGQSLWIDEAFTARLLGGSLGHTLSGVARWESTPPLYYVLVWGWSQIFGHSEVALRSLSALFGVACVPVMFMVVDRLVGRRAAAVAALLVATSPALVWYSGEARSYSLWLLLSAIGLLFWIRALDAPERRNLTWWTAASCLALCTHYLAFAFVAPQALWLLRRHPKRRTGVAVGAIGLVALALVPLALDQRSHGTTDWISAFPVGYRLKHAYWLFATGIDLTWESAAPVIAVLAEVGVVLALFRGPKRPRRGALLSISLAGTALALALLGGLVGHDYLIGRNILPCLLLLAIAVAAAAGSPGRAGVAGAVIALAICALFLREDVRAGTTRSLQRDDWRAAARVLGRPSSRRAIVLAPGWMSPVLQYYAPHVHSMSAPISTRELDIVTSYAGSGRVPAAPAGGFKVQSDVWIQQWRIHIVQLRARRAARVAPSSLTTGTTDGYQAFTQSPGPAS